MKTLLAALVLASLSPSVHAAECDPSKPTTDCTAAQLSLAPTSPMSMAPELAAQRRAALRLRNAGIGLVVAGTVATIVGAAYFNAASQNAFCDSCNISAAESTRQDHYATTGIALLGVGQVAAFTGIFMWAKGGVRAHKLDQPRVQASATGVRVTF